jgi:regulator of RNase E activity RraA
LADLQVPISCAGVAVYSGDVLVADRDGVLVIPGTLAAEAAEQGYEQEQLEAFVSPPGELAAADHDPA